MITLIGFSRSFRLLLLPSPHRFAQDFFDQKLISSFVTKKSSSCSLELFDWNELFFVAAVRKHRRRLSLLPPSKSLQTSRRAFGGPNAVKVVKAIVRKNFETCDHQHFFSFVILRKDFDSLINAITFWICKHPRKRELIFL